MKRDMELVREILLHVESRTDLVPRPVEIAGYNHTVVARHVELLIAHGLLEGQVKQSGRDHSSFCIVTDMSWEGHDFLSALKDKDVWNRIKQSFDAAQLAGMPFSVLKEIGVELFKQWAKRQVGL